MAIDDVPPSFNGVSEEAVPWARWVTGAVKELSANLGTESTRVSNALRTGQGALSVTETQSQDIVAAQEEASTAQTVAFRTPGDNLFDTRPIANRDITGWDVVNIGPYSWLSDGIEITLPETATAGSGLETVVWNREVIPLSGTGTSQTMALYFDAFLSETVSSPPYNTVSLLTRWLDSSGSVVTGYTSEYSAVETGAQFSYGAPVPPTAVSLQLGFKAVRRSGQSTSITVRFRNPSVRFQITSEAIPNTLTLKELAGSTLSGGTNIPSTGALQFRDSLNNIVYSLTSAGGMPISLTTGNLPATRLTGPILNAQIGGSQVDLAQLTNAVLAKLANIGSFRNIYNDPDLSTGYQSIPNNTWTQMPLQTLTSDYTRKNTLNDGAAATITSNYIVVPKTGRYLVNIAVRFSANSAGTARGVAAQVNTGPRQMENNMRVPGNATLPAFPIPMTCTAEVEAVAGDTIRPAVTQNSGGALNVRLETFTVSYLGPS